MLKKIVFGVGCAILVLNCPPRLSAEETAQVVKANDQDPAAAVEAWLAAVDGGRYDQSWETASAYFKSMVSKEQWVSLAAAVRNPLGNLVSRSVNEKQFQSALPGAPDGQYCILSFKTVFGNKASAIETVTTMKDKDGQWRVAGYFIK